jgi:L-lactate dehydrogenase
MEMISTQSEQRAAGTGRDTAATWAAVRPERADGVAVIGAGNVGASVANALVLLGVTDRLVIYDRQLSRAEGEAWDIADGTPLLRSAQVDATDDWQDLAGVAVVVVAVGARPRPGQSRLDERNAELIRAVIQQLDTVAADAVVVIVSNPVDVMTRVAQEASTRPWQRIIGTGTVLDTSRLRHELARRLGVDPRNAHVHVIGEHGESSFPAWSSAIIGPVPLARFPLPDLADLASIKAESAELTRSRGPAVYARKGHTNAGIAVAAARIAESVLRDQRRIYTVSTRAPQSYGVGDAAVLSIPCVLGRQGAIRRLPLALSNQEREKLARSASILEAAYHEQSRGTRPTESTVALDLDTTEEP